MQDKKKLLLKSSLAFLKSADKMVACMLVCLRMPSGHSNTGKAARALVKANEQYAVHSVNLRTICEELK